MHIFKINFVTDIISRDKEFQRTKIESEISTFL